MMLCSRIINEKRLVSLLEMLKFSASDWNNIIRELDVIHHAFLNKTLVHGDRVGIITSLKKIQESCHHIGLTFSSSYIERIIDSVIGMETLPEFRASIREYLSKAGEVSSEKLDKIGSEKASHFGQKEFENEINTLKTRIDDELRGRDFFALEQKWVPYFYGTSPFGEAVFTVFPKAIKDIEEASKCLALERGTACVFHLMRVMEEGLKQLAKMLNIPYAPSWESYLKQIKDRVEQRYKHKGIQWKKDEPFFKELLGNLESVKIAWRNPTMHIVRNYDVTEAEQVLISVRIFMQKLAERQIAKKLMREKIVNINIS